MSWRRWLHAFTLDQRRRAPPALELLSRGLLAAIGAWLLFRAVRGEPHRHDACPWDLWRVSYRARLTLFAMVYALANGVPAAGVAFAAAMLLGVALTLCVVALLTIFAREWCVRSWTRHGASLAHLSRLLEGATGVALLLIGLAPFVSVMTAKDMSVASAPTLKTLHFEDKGMLDRQERHGGEEAVVFPPFRPMVVGTYPKGE